jgi:hypothetical protein
MPTGSTALEEGIPWCGIRGQREQRGSDGGWWLVVMVFVLLEGYGRHVKNVTRDTPPRVLTVST